jgi:Kef-type K+ transport system membrane component KefB
LRRPETTLIACIGICFGLSILAEHAGYSVALGAFLAGSMVAESGETHSIEHLVTPLRDIFGAVFFISVGMTLDPMLLAQHWIALTVLVLAVILGKLVGVTMASLLSGVGIHTSVQAGMSLTQIGEFSFIIAGLGVSTHARLSLHAGRGRLGHHDLYHSFHDQSVGSARPLHRWQCAVPPGGDPGCVRFADGTDSAGSRPLRRGDVADSDARWRRARYCGT